MNPNSIIPVKCTPASFFRAWMEILTPFHKLTSREKDVAARILMQYFKFKENVEDPEVLNELLWSRRSRKDIMDSLGMSQAHFQMVLGKLRSSGVIRDGKIYHMYIPKRLPGDKRYCLQVIFDWSSPSNPVPREKQDREG